MTDSYETIATEIGARAGALAERLAAEAVDAAAELGLLFAERALADPRLRDRVAPLLERARPATGPVAVALQAAPRLAGRIGRAAGQAGARAALFALTAGEERR